MELQELCKTWVAVRSYITFGNKSRKYLIYMLDATAQLSVVILAIEVTSDIAEHSAARPCLPTMLEGHSNTA